MQLKLGIKLDWKKKTLDVEENKQEMMSPVCHDKSLALTKDL